MGAKQDQATIPGNVSSLDAGRCGEAGNQFKSSGDSALMGGRGAKHKGGLLPDGSPVPAHEINVGSERVHQ